MLIVDKNNQFIWQPDIDQSIHGSYRNLLMKFNEFSMTFQGSKSSNGRTYPGKK